MIQIPKIVRNSTKIGVVIKNSFHESRMAPPFPDIHLLPADFRPGIPSAAPQAIPQVSGECSAHQPVADLVDRHDVLLQPQLFLQTLYVQIDRPPGAAVLAAPYVFIDRLPVQRPVLIAQK